MAKEPDVDPRDREKHVPETGHNNHRVVSVPGVGNDRSLLASVNVRVRGVLRDDPGDLLKDFMSICSICENCNANE